MCGSLLAIGLASPSLAQDNSSSVDQTGSGSIAAIVQSGSANESLVTQDGSPTGVDGFANEATITQAGVEAFSEATQTGDNQLTVTQTASSNGVNSEVIQANAGGGASNVASVEQEGIGSGVGSGTGSFIEQIGEGGSITVDQDDLSINATSVVFQSGTISRATILQRGSPFGPSEDNFSIVDQSGDDHSVLVFQLGENNSANVTQSNVDNGSGVVQTGARNTSFGSQTGVDGLPGIEQDGDDNSSSAIQSGDTNLTDLLQEGDLNDSAILQAGTSNVIGVRQFGDGHVSNIDQSGTGNSAVVTQNSQ